MTGLGRVLAARRRLVFGLGTAASLLLASAYTASAVLEGGIGGSGAPPPADPSAVATARAGPHVMAIDADGFAPHWLRLGRLADGRPDGVQEIGLACDRLHMQASGGICLSGQTRELLLLDAGLNVEDRIDLQGLPSRARVSPDGRTGAATVFVTGHSYAEDGFSTHTVLVDMAGGEVLTDLEQFTVTRDGVPFQAADFNFWGITFVDSDRFYATLGTGGETYLVEGSVRDRTATVVRDGVECPSLSPDGTRIAFKHRASESFGMVHWEIHVLDLATMTETTLGESRSVDDQIEWLDDDRILYALPRDGASAQARVYDTWILSARDPEDDPRVFMAEAASPTVNP